MSYFRSHRLRITMLVILLGLLVIAAGWMPAQIALAESNPAAQLWQRVWSVGAQRFSADPVTAAWERVQAAGSYHFTSDVVQITIPTAKVTNVGRPSRTEQIHLEGQSDLEAAAFEFQLWSGGGSVHSPESSLAVRAANGKSYTRQGTGAWQESSSYSDAIAPEGDFMAYLAAARNITPHAPETRAGIAFTRYSFQIDGPTFAAFSRNQMEAAIRARGELPEGVHFDLSSYYRDMTGDGELWVRADGLPLRQLLNLRFPEQSDSTVQAQIKVDFSHFGQSRFVGGEFVQVDPASTGGSLAGLFAMLPRQAVGFGFLGVLLPFVVLAVLVVYYRRARTLQVAISLAVIASMVVGPLLNTLKMTTFLDAQAARAADQSATQKESAMLRDLRAQDSAPQFNPNQNPLEAAASAPALAPANAPLLQATAVLTVETGLDTDGDLLTDFVEQRIGTSATISDTDGDQISDRVEVNGFTLGGKQWYPNPLEADSNHDSIPDTLEYDIDQNSQPDDTDSDGIPNLFDEDNDGDGVADPIDLAPLVASTTPYGESTPLQLQVENLTGSNSSNAVPTFVDFQVRPQSPDQIQFAFNPLDWPQDDKGQIKDIDNQPADMKLVPMLEIRIPNGGAMLPPPSELDPYQIAVSNGEAAGEKVAYVPLNLVTDQQSGQRVAFSGRMRYLPTAAWQANTVRMVWLVQMANDIACDPKNSADLAKGCTPQGYLLNQGQIIHRYYENWVLTGLNVTEEHGAKIAVIYEDPSRDANPNDDTPMWLLPTVLEERFTKPTGSTGNLQRQVTMDNLVATFDWNTVGAGNAAGLFGLPNHFKVTPVQTYPTFDAAIYGTSSVISNTVLGAFNTSVKPLLLFAYETNIRSVGLDVLRTNSSYAAMNGSQITIRFQPNGQLNTEIDTTAGFKWNPYCSTGGTPSWAICDAKLYAQELAARHGNQFLDPDTLTGVSQQDADVARAMMLVTQLYALTIQHGFNNIVRQDYGAGDVRIVTGLNPAESDSELESYVRSGLNFTGQGIKFATNFYVLKQFQIAVSDDPAPHAVKINTLMKNALKVDAQGTISTIKNSRFLKGSSVVLVLGTLTAVALALAGYEEAAEALNIAVGVAQITLSVAVPLRMASIGAKVAGTTFTQALRGLSENIAYTKFAAYVGAALAIGITWGFFIYSVVSNDIAVGSPEFNRALAETIAATILIILLAVLALTVVGLIIVGIISAIDIILTLICKFAPGGDNLKTDFTGGCFTLSGAATKVIAYALYNYDLMINTNQRDLVTFGVPKLTLANPNLGYAAGNNLSLTMPITTHVVHKDPDAEQGLYINFYLWLFSKDNLRSSTFKYSATQPNEEKISGLERFDIASQWFNVREDHKYVLTPMYGGYYTTTVTANNIPLQVGINQPAKFYHNMGFAVPAYECWVVPVVNPVAPVTPICYTRTFRNNTSEPVETIVFDVFPASLNQFMALAAKGDGGVGLAWATEFRALQDADGDGLLAGRYGGLDPDDTQWDTDGDGLTDSFELQQRQAGVNLSPVQKDSDSDGLTDAQERRFGSNPGVADSDNDGLLDGAELWHQNVNTGNWEGGLSVRINASTPFTVRVSSNSNAFDSDDDGLSDGAETQLAQLTDLAQRNDSNNVPYHPNVVNTPPVRFYLSSDAFNHRYVKPGQQFAYTTTVIATAPLAPGVLDVDVLNSNGASSNLLGTTSTRYALPFDPLNFSATQTVTQQTNFTVDSNAQTQSSVSVNNTVRTQVAGGGPAPWQWNSAAGTWNHPLPYRPQVSAVAPTTLDRQDQYRLASRNSIVVSLNGSNGELQTQDFQSGTQRQLDNDRFTRTVYYNQAVAEFIEDVAHTNQTNNKPDIACNESGYCLVVWDYIDECSTATIDSVKVNNIGSGEGGGGAEPAIYLIRRGNSDFDPTDGGYELLWYAEPIGNGGINIPAGGVRGPNANGFPITLDFCSGSDIAVYEHDNATNVTNTRLTNWNGQDLAARFSFPRRGGFWESLSDTRTETFSSSAAGNFDLTITSRSQQIHKVAGALLAPNGVVLSQQFNLSSSDGARVLEFYRPTVATDGKDFLVAWEQATLPLGIRSIFNSTVGNALITRRFAGDGTPLGANTVVANSLANTTLASGTTQLTVESRPRARLAMNWVGDRYLITRLLSPYQVNATGEWGQGITIRALDRSGQLVAGTSAQQLISSARNDTDTGYDWAYDPINKRGLLVYWEKNAPFWMEDRFFTSNGSGGYTVSQPPYNVIATLGDYESPQVEYDPATKGWLVGHTSSGYTWFIAHDAGMTTPLGNLQQFATQYEAGSNALACPAATSLPVADLRFEELPGATTFADRSGYGNNATCSGNQCPIPGAAGAPGAQLSAYALEFDGGDDRISLPNTLSGSFSLAFWYKAGAGGNGPAFYITSNPPNTNNNPGFGLFIYNDTGVIEWWAGGAQSSANSSLNDGNWHFVAATYTGSTGALNLYLDGAPNPVASGNTTQAPTLGSTIEIGGGSTRVSLDPLQVYGVALSKEAVTALRTRANQSFCLATTANATTPVVVNGLNLFPVQWRTLSLTRQESFAPFVASAASKITVDNDAPTASVTGAQYIKIDGNGSTILTIGGAAQDPTSGVGSVAVSVNNAGFQPASGRESWVYQFPVTEGAYTIQAKATDILGNVGNPSASKTIIADATPPLVTINAIANPLKPVLNGNGNWQVSLSGTASDPSIGALPGSGVYTNSVALRLLGPGGVTVGDTWQTAAYNANSNQWTINYLFPAARLDVTGVYTVNVRAEDRAGANGGNSTGDAGATAILRLDHSGPAAALSNADAARQFMTNTVTIAGPVASPISGIASVEVAFTTVEQIAVLPNNVSAAEAQTLLDAGGRTWLPAALVQQGAGITSTTWSLVIPATLEDEYQIDLRGTDVLGNVRVISNAWRGIIDTRAPRVSIVRTDTGSSYNSGPNLLQQLFKYECVAEDRYLSEAAFVCPANSYVQPTLSFNTDPLLQTLFPDRTILTRMEAVGYRWESGPQLETIGACDLFGRCATASTGQTVTTANTQFRAAAEITAAAAGEPQALVISPVEGRYVAANGDLPVTIVAEAAASLQQVTVELDGALVATLAFAQSESITRTQRTIQLPNVAEGVHTLVAKATDWAGAVQATLYPVNFTLDAASPTVTLNTNLLGLASTWALGSDMLRFRGTANDSVGLAAVQIKIGDAPFTEATFDETTHTWSTAQQVPDPEGKTLAVRVQAIDRAGRITEVTGNIGVALTTTNPPETVITAQPSNPSSVNSADFSFTGTDGAGNALSAFGCRLDDGEFLLCGSPQSYPELSNGLHRFAVRAIDDEGFVDPTPANVEWTVQVTTLATTITSSPANPTNSRDASFAFTGSTGVIGFECSLDSAAYTTCNGNGLQSYTGLSDGSHTFQVRGLDGAGNKGTATRFTWTVVNAAPVANSQTVTTTENAAIALTLSATDADPLTYNVGNPAHGVLLGVPPALTYSPDSGFFGSDSFTFVANDDLSDSNVATVSITVVANVTDNTPPVITPQVVGTTGSNGWYVSDVSLTWSVVDAESVVTSQTGCDPATVNTETAGQVFTCSATSRGGTTSQSITIKLDKTAPETTITAQPANPSNTATAAFQFTGADGLSGNAGFECSLDSGAFSPCTSPQNYSNLAEGNHTFQVQAVDGAGNRDATPASYTWTVQTLTVVATCGPITVYRNLQGQLVAPGWVGTIKLGTAGNNTIAGGSGRDLILGLGGNDNLDGKAGDDLICGGDGVDLLTGAAGNDSLDGGIGNDVLNGGAGDFDSLTAGDGNDVLLDADGVISALGGPGNDAFTIALRNGWRDQSGQPRFTGLAAGYGNDAVGLAILGTVRFFLDITGDERDTPPSPLEGTDDGLVLVGLRDPASVIIKFERRVGAASVEAESEGETPISYEGFLVDPTTLTDESGSEFLTEAVGGFGPVEEGEQAEEVRMFVFLPLVASE